MLNFRTVVMTGLVLLALPGTAHPAEQPKHDVALLVDSRDALTWEAQNATGVDRNRIRGQAREMQHMIDRLERGEQVDEAELDRLLNRAH